jgi:hypothetical protein
MAWTHTEEFKQAAREARLENPTLINDENDRALHEAVMANPDVPLTASPSLEIQWIAFNVDIPDADWRSVPSKVAAQWLRKLRIQVSGKPLRVKFWTDTWPFYMESRLGLELKAERVVPSKKKGAAVRTDESVQDSIDGMTGKKDVA